MVPKQTQLILIDLMDGTLFTERTLTKGHYIRPPSKLAFGMQDGTRDQANPKSLIRTIRRLRKQSSWKHAHVVIGTETDPLYPFVGRFDLMVKCIEEIASEMPAQITIQTRSPLVVLALPLLKRIADQLTVVFGFGSLNDSFNQRYTPHLPRPSERMTAARTLHRFGINVHLQVAPIVGGRTNLRGMNRRALSQFVNACDSAASSIEIIPIQQIVDRNLSPMMTTSQLGGEFQRVSHQTLRELCRAELTQAELYINPDLLSDVAA